MASPETYMPHRFDTLLDAEIERVKNAEKREPPAEKNPLSLEEYRDYAAEETALPTDEQVRNFIELLQNDRDLLQYAKAGYKVVPVLMAHEHGYATFDLERLKQYGYLNYYLLDENNLTVRTGGLAYMDAVLPPEIIENGAEIPENLLEPETLRAFHQQFGESVRRLPQMLR